jgi:hypothetical protein
MTMSDGALFGIIIGGLFVLRVLAATVVFLVLLPRNDRCINCDAVTVRLSSPLDRVLPFFRKSWCLRCGWVGMLRRGAVSAPAELREPAVRH